MDNLHFRACYDELADCGGNVSEWRPWRKTFGEAKADLKGLQAKNKGMSPNFFVEAKEASEAPLGS